MNFLYQLIVVLHLLGMAALVGGWLTLRPRVSPTMLWGARAQLVTGVVLVGLLSAGAVDDTPNNAKVGVKLLVALVVAGLAEVQAKRQKDRPQATSAAMVDAAGGLAVLNVMIAALWT